MFWSSQQIVEKLGQAAFERYVSAFDYGNKDVSAVPVKSASQNGVWVVSSLQISANEQIAFLRKLVNRELPIGTKAYEQTAPLIQYESTINGKTGTGSPGTDNHYDPEHAYGWYVGWATKVSISLAQIGPVHFYHGSFRGVIPFVLGAIYDTLLRCTQQEVRQATRLLAYLILAARLSGCSSPPPLYPCSW